MSESTAIHRHLVIFSQHKTPQQVIETYRETKTQHSQHENCVVTKSSHKFKRGYGIRNGTY